MQECNSAMEYLSDPWVMVLVIHCPSVLNQWLVAAYAEVLRFQQQISDFHYLPYPETCKEAVSLLHAAESAKEAIARSFQALKTLISLVGTKYCLSPQDWPLKDLQKDLNTILRQLKKVRSEKGQNVIKALKRLCWNGSNKGPLLKPVELCMRCVFHDANLCYRRFWELNIRNHFFLPSSLHEKCPGKGYCKFCSQISKENTLQIKEFDSILKTRPNYKDRDLTKKKMSQFFDDHLKDRFVQQAKKDDFVAHLTKKEMLFLHWKFDQIESKAIFI